METLVLDCTNRWLTTGVFGGIKEADSSREGPRDCSRFFLEDVRQVLQNAGCEKPDRVICAHGPGSFTGTRICIASARNLSQLWDIPIGSVDSLSFYLKSVINDSRYSLHFPVTVLLDAKMRRCYAKTIMHENEVESTLSVDIDPNQINFDGSVLVDDIDSVASYMQSEEMKNRLIPMFPPAAKDLHYFADSISFDSFESIHPVYLRSDPATAKFPQGLQK